MNTSPDEKLDRAVKQLPHAIEPEHDLWPGIAARIATRRAGIRSRSLWSYGNAAAAILVVGISILWFTAGNRTPQPDNSNASTTVPAYHPGPDALDNPRAVFAAQLAGDKRLSPKVRAALLGNLHLVQVSIQRTQAALRKYPDDVNLQALLINLYQQEARLTDEAQQAQIQTTTRNTI